MSSTSDWHRFIYHGHRDGNVCRCHQGASNGPSLCQIFCVVATTFSISDVLSAYVRIEGDPLRLAVTFDSTKAAGIPCSSGKLKSVPLDQPEWEWMMHVESKLFECRTVVGSFVCVTKDSDLALNSQNLQSEYERFVSAS